MTNAMIILLEQTKLAEEGILQYTGRMIDAVNVMTGEPTQIPEIQPIHTYNGWKARGFQVKKGEKAVAKFPIWKYTKRKTKEMAEEEAQQKGYCFMKMSAWFTDTQVEQIKAEEQA